MSVSGFRVNGVTERYNYNDLENIDVQTDHIHDEAVTMGKLSGEVAEMLNAKELPDLPLENGRYRLCCHITDGTFILFWEDD